MVLTNAVRLVCTGVTICKPASNMGWEKSIASSRSAVIEIAAMPRSTPLDFTASNNSLTVGLTMNSDLTFSCLAISFRSSTLKPVQVHFLQRQKV